MLVPALLVSLVAGLANLDYCGFLLMLHRPLVTGALTGFVLGDFAQGLIIGSALELMWLGVTGIGGYTPPDTISGAIIGTALGILSGQGLEAGIAIAVPVSVITQQLDIIAKTLDIYFVKKADRAAELGQIDRIGRYHYLSIALVTLFKMVPVFLAVYIGGEYVEWLFGMIPDVIMTGLTVAGGILPAVGLGMLLNMMLKKDMWVFLLIGFVCSAFAGLSTIAITLIGVAIAYFYSMLLDSKQRVAQDGALPTSEPSPVSAGSEEEVYDL